MHIDSQIPRGLLLSLVLLISSACDQQADTPDSQVTMAGQNLPVMTVYKSPSCGCCAKWVDHMREAGFEVVAQDQQNMGVIKERLGIQPPLGSCHTAEIDGYVIEGHVPASEVRRLLKERPEAAGLAVPGMPVGSPGMEQGDREDRYEVLLFAHDKPPAIFARYPKSQDVLSK